MHKPLHITKHQKTSHHVCHRHFSSVHPNESDLADQSTKCIEITDSTLFDSPQRTPPTISELRLYRHPKHTKKRDDLPKKILSAESWQLASLAPCTCKKADLF
jgi:hypothetical protein